MWYSVNRGEQKNIFPFQEKANIMFNSSIVYELAVLKKYALPLLQAIPADSIYYPDAHRLMGMLKFFIDMPDDWVPCNSLMREFIGGSCYADV
jgi:uridine kinase